MGGNLMFYVAACLVTGCSAWLVSVVTGRHLVFDMAGYLVFRMGLLQGVQHGARRLGTPLLVQ